MDRMIRVAIADDNEQFRETLREILGYEQDMTVVAAWENAVDAIAGLQRADANVILLDINMPLMTGVEATKRLVHKFPELKIIILTMHDDSGYVLETLKSGACGYLVKDGSVSEIVRAIREVVAGRAIVHPQVTPTVIHQFQRSSQTNDSWREILTEREMEVLRELSTGKTNSEVADALHLMEKTVKNHVSNILSKLSVSDRTQAVVVAMKRRWLTP